jgi:hypothetical protein
MTASSLFAFAVSIVLYVGAFAKAVGDEMLLLACVLDKSVSSNFHSARMA